MPLNIVVLYGSVRFDRQGIKVARFVIRQLEARGHHVTFVDPCVEKLGLLERMYKEYPTGEAPENLERLGTFERFTVAAQDPQTKRIAGQAFTWTTLPGWARARTDLAAALR